MKIFAYALRPYDELGYLDELSRELGFEYGWTADYPTLDNAPLAAGADGAVMSGSGPTVVGLFSNRNAAEACACALSNTYRDVFCVETM